MDFSWFSARERRRRAAARWFAQMRGENADRHRRRFEQWHASADNAAAYARIAQSFDSAALLRLSRPAEGEMPPPSDERPSQAVRIALAASIALLLAIPATLLVSRAGPFADRPAMLMVSTMVGETRKVALADGSSITLDSDSALRYEAGSGAGHVVLERGRARFGSTGTNPIRVEAGGLLVEASGALFDVSLAGTGVAVSSLRGHVRLGSGKSTSDLAPGSAAMASGGSIRAMALVDPSWPTGMLEFKNEPLREAVARANRYSTTKIRLSGDLGRLRITGAHRAGDQQGLARSLAKAFDLEVLSLPGGELQLRDRSR